MTPAVTKEKVAEEMTQLRPEITKLIESRFTGDTRNRLMDRVLAEATRNQNMPVLAALGRVLQNEGRARGDAQLTSAGKDLEAAFSAPPTRILPPSTMAPPVRQPEKPKQEAKEAETKEGPKVTLGTSAGVIQERTGVAMSAGVSIPVTDSGSTVGVTGGGVMTTGKGRDWSASATYTTAGGTSVFAYRDPMYAVAGAVGTSVPVVSTGGESGPSLGVAAQAEVGKGMGSGAYATVSSRIDFSAGRVSVSGTPMISYDGKPRVGVLAAAAVRVAGSEEGSRLEVGAQFYRYSLASDQPAYTGVLGVSGTFGK